jgi:hypothetical protein
MKKLYTIVGIVAVLNFVAYLIVTSQIGGDAINGGEQAGHFYLSAHGRRTEVSRSTYMFSRYHTYSLWITHPLAMICGFLYVKLENDKRAKTKA